MDETLREAEREAAEEGGPDAQARLAVAFERAGRRVDAEAAYWLARDAGAPWDGALQSIGAARQSLDG